MALFCINFLHLKKLIFQFQIHFFLLSVAGLLVGVGTRIGGGCTSGHGISGIGRFSLRSIIATITFMIVGTLTILVKNLVWVKLYLQFVE